MRFWNSQRENAIRGMVGMAQRSSRRSLDKWLGVLLLVGWAVLGTLAWKPWQQGDTQNRQLVAASAATVRAASAQVSESRLASQAKVTIYVVGEVKRPGLYHLPLDSRLVDAIRAAGGATAKADLQAINLAAIAEDGTEIVVPSIGESSGAGTVSAAASLSIATPAKSRGKKLPNGVKIPLNQAAVVTLETLPGIGVKKAQAIVAYRRAHGLFTSLEQLSAVKGIGPKLLAKVLPYLTLR